MIELLAVGMVAISALIALLARRGLDRWRAPLPGDARLILSGLLPTILIVIALVVWHYLARSVYEHGLHRGFVSPLVMLIYGFPVFALNLFLNFYAAHWAGKRA